jgi:hypothetical protein
MDQPSREAMAGKLQIYGDRGRGAMTLPRPRNKVNGSHDMCKPSGSRVCGKDIRKESSHAVPPGSVGQVAAKPDTSLWDGTVCLTVSRLLHSIPSGQTPGTCPHFRLRISFRRRRVRERFGYCHVALRASIKSLLNRWQLGAPRNRSRRPDVTA